MSFGYPQLYSNGLNNNTQLRRSTDMIYQRGATYQVTLTGSSYQSSMQLDVDMYADGTKVGRMQIVPASIESSGGIYYYYFNIRPYDYMQNYVQSQHYTYYWLNNWYETNNTININNPYPNIVQADFKYGYTYQVGVSGITEYSGSPSNDLNHYTDIPYCSTTTGFTASGFTNTGNKFDYVGGAFQLDERFILQNFDQELGSVVGTGLTINTVDRYRNLSPMSQFMMTYPTLPEQSETSRFLTDAPRIQYIQSDENYVLYYLNGQSGDRQVIESDFVVFEFFDESNNLITTFDQELNYSGTTYASPTGYTDNLSVFALPCGPKDISNIFTTVNWDNVAYYTAQIYYGFATNITGRTSTGAVGPLSECFYFYLYNNCLPENTRLVWLNNRGGYDYYTFQSYRQDTKKIDRQTFDNRYYATNIQSPDRDIARTVKTFDTNLTREIVLESNYLSVAYGHWIEQLFYSPQVYIMKEDFISPLDRQDKVYKDLRPVQVISTEVETITKKHKKLNKYRITLKAADSFFVNRGF